MIHDTTCYACDSYNRDGYDPACPTCRAELIDEKPRYLFRWHGGSSYAGLGHPEPAASLEEIRRTMAARESGWDSYRPCAEDSTAYVYRVAGDIAGTLDHIGGGDPYPDMVATMGPRGGVRIDPA